MTSDPDGPDPLVATGSAEDDLVRLLRAAGAPLRAGIDTEASRRHVHLAAAAAVGSGGAAQRLTSRGRLRQVLAGGLTLLLLTALAAAVAVERVGSDLSFAATPADAPIRTLETSQPLAMDLLVNLVESDVLELSACDALIEELEASAGPDGAVDRRDLPPECRGFLNGGRDRLTFPGRADAPGASRAPPFGGTPPGRAGETPRRTGETPGRSRYAPGRSSPPTPS